MSNNFLEDTRLKRATTSDNIEEILTDLFNVINTNKSLTAVKVDEVFFRAGKMRSQLTDADLERLKNNDFEQIDELPALQISTEKSLITIANYINKAPINKALAVVVDFIKNGEISDLLKRFENSNLEITRSEISMRLSNYLDGLETRVNKYYEDFFGMIPRARGLYSDKTRLVFNPSTSNILVQFRRKEDKRGNLPSEEEIAYFNAKLQVLRKNVKNLVCPDLDTALEIMGMAASTYRNNVKLAEGELYRQLILQN